MPGYIDNKVFMKAKSTVITEVFDKADAFSVAFERYRKSTLGNYAVEVI